MPTYTVAPVIKHDFGASRAGYKLFVYLSGTNTKTTTYADSAGSASNTNPIVLDSAGRATIFVAQTTLKYVLALPTDTDPPTSPVWTVDGVMSVPNINGTNVDVTGTMGEVLAVGNCVYLSDGAGSRTAGRWYKTDATLAYASALAEQLGVWATSDGTAAAGMTGTVRTKGRWASASGMVAGTIYYLSSSAGTLQGTPVSGYERIFCLTDSTTSFVFPLERPTERRLYSNYTDHGSLAADGGTTLGTALLAIPVRAGLLAQNGQGLRLTVCGIMAANANTKAVSIGLTTQTAGDGTLGMGLIGAAAINGKHWTIRSETLRVSATSARSLASVDIEATAPADDSVVYGTVSPLTFAAEMTLTIYGKAATADDDVVLKMVCLEFLP